MDSNGTCANGTTSDMDLTNADESSKIETYLNNLPAEVEKHLEFITANKDGHILMGSSNLTGRYWCGSVWYYTDPSLAPSIDGSKAALEFIGGVTDCAFFDENRAIVGQDGGLIDFIAIKECEGCFRIERLEQIEDHGYSVTSVKLMSNRKTAITAAMDMGIRLWDCHTTACTHNFTPAHTQEVTSVAPHPNHPEIFLSSALDGNAFLWDLRCPKPASCVFRDVDNCPTAVAWLPSGTADGMQFALGNLSGSLHLRDPKILTESISTIQPLSRPVFRIVPNRFRNDQIAVCANEATVLAFNVEEGKLKRSYYDNRHSDFVRGLEWLDERSFITCGWDKKVFVHTLSRDDVAS